MKQKRLAAFVFVAACGICMAAPPQFRTNTCAVRLDGVNVGADLTSGNSSLRNTVAWDAATGHYHWWGFVADDAAFPSVASALPALLHATSADGIHFVSDVPLAYSVSAARYASFGAAIDPPLDFLRAAFDTASGTWKLLNWSENDQQNPSRWGQYNYNTSISDLGSVASNTSVVHQGPLNTPVAGNHVGAFGLVDGKLYLRVDSAGGGNGRFAYTDAIPPSTGAELDEADLYTGTPYCWSLAPGCGTTDARKPAYVHNVGRTLRQRDGTLGTYYTFRDASTAARLDMQIWYVESADDGASWSAPVGVFEQGSAVTIDRRPLDAVPGSANFSHIDVVVAPRGYRAYFSTRDSAGKLVFVAAASIAADTLFEDSFDGCG
jgi:hypothetical protein